MDMSLIERIGTTGEARVWYGDIPLESEYTAGIAGERFFRNLKDKGVLSATVCHTCEITYLPPSTYCERCFSELDDWVEVPSSGMVETYTIMTHSLEGEPLTEPQVIALIRMDGVHGGLVHRLGEIDPEDVEIGLPVEAILKPPEEREGSILDIKYFKPL
jgi:uncharacterized OB-fold protein